MGDKTAGTVVIAFMLIWAAAIIGWCMNIWKIAMALNEPITGLFVFRCIGVVAAPIGAILGYF